MLFLAGLEDKKRKLLLYINYLSRKIRSEVQAKLLAYTEEELFNHR